MSVRNKLKEMWRVVWHRITDPASDWQIWFVGRLNFECFCPVILIRCDRRGLADFLIAQCANKLTIPPLCALPRLVLLSLLGLLAHSNSQPTSDGQEEMTGWEQDDMLPRTECRSFSLGKRTHISKVLNHPPIQFSLSGAGACLSLLSWGEGGVTPWTRCQFDLGPHT